MKIKEICQLRFKILIFPDCKRLCLHTGFVATLLVWCGFVEAPALLPAATCDKLYGLDRSAAVLISNARQLSVQGAELRLVESALEQSLVVRQTVLAVFGTEEFIVPKDSLKVGGPRHAHPMPHAPCRMPCASCPVPGAEV